MAKRHSATSTEGGWSISAESYGTRTLVELYGLLEGHPNRAQRHLIQRELVNRALREGLSTQDILNTLTRGVGTKRGRSAIAKEWCNALGLSEAEAKRLAG